MLKEWGNNLQSWMKHRSSGYTLMVTWQCAMENDRCMERFWNWRGHFGWEPPCDWDHGTPEHRNPIYWVNYPLVNTMESRHFVWENSLQMAIFNSYRRVSSRHQFYQDGIFQSSTPRKLRVGGSGWIMFSVSMMGASCMPEDCTPDVMSKTNSNM